MKNLNIKIFMGAFIMAVLSYSIFCFAHKPELVVNYKSVNVAFTENCRLLEQIDSIVKTAKDSLPDCYLGGLSRISLLGIYAPRDTSYYTYNGKRLFNIKSYKPTSQDIINIFNGRKPSHDLKIVFSSVFIINNNYNALIYKETPYFIEDYIYNILQTEFKFNKIRMKQKYWDNVPIFYEPVFSVVVTKAGILRDIKYSKGQTWIKQIYD